MRLLVLFALLIGPLLGCDDYDGSKARAAVAESARSGPCAEFTVLLATTAGSPDVATCPNRLHRLEVSTATLAGKTVAATVTCRCLREGDGGAP